MHATTISRAVEGTITAERQALIRDSAISAIGSEATTKGVKSVESSVGSDFEQGAFAVCSAKFGGAVKVAVGTLDQRRWNRPVEAA